MFQEGIKSNSSMSLGWFAILLSQQTSSLAMRTSEFKCKKRYTFHLGLCNFCRYLQDTLGNATGYTYQASLIRDADSVQALQSKAVEFIYGTSASIACVIAEIPGSVVTANAGVRNYGRFFWNEAGTIVALSASNITTVWAQASKLVKVPHW